GLRELEVDERRASRACGVAGPPRDEVRALVERALAQARRGADARREARRRERWRRAAACARRSSTPQPAQPGDRAGPSSAGGPMSFRLKRDPLANPDALIRRVYAYAAYRLGDGPDAEEVTSEVFERAVRYRDSYDRSKGEPVAWLLGIASRCASSALAARAGDQPSPDDPVPSIGFE